MTWSAVGTVHGSHTAALSLSNQATGNLLVVEVINFSNNTVHPTGLTGGGATWVQAGTTFNGTVNAWSAAVFFGTVTATGAQTATPTWSGTTPASYSLAAWEFHSTVGAWVLDRQGNLDSAGTGNWISLTPSFGAGELYFGFAGDITSATAGSTSGYTYSANADTAGNGLAFNASCPGTATFPNWTDGQQGTGIMVLVAESISVNPPPVPLPLLPPGWFPGSDRVTASPGAAPFTPQPGTTDAAPAVIFPSFPEAAGYLAPLLPPGWFPGADRAATEPDGIPFAQQPPPADPSQAILPPPAPDNIGIADWLPLPPGYFPGSQTVTVDPGGIPFYSQPQPLTPPPAPLPLPVITGQAGTGLGAYFHDQNGNPRLYLGAETWGLPANAGRWNGGNWRGDYDSYHATRAAQGYTANVTHPWGHTHTGCNNDLGHTWDGIFPFLVGGAAADLTGQVGTITLNDPFWQRIDYMLASAAGQGITVFLDMAMSNDMPAGAAHGFTNGVFQNATTAQIQAASQAVATRYAATQNLVWFFGDDYYNDDDADFNAMWTGINAADPRVAGCTSIEYYPTGNTARYDLSGAPGGETPHGWGNTHATYNFVYCYMQTYFGIEYAYTEPSPIGPVIWGDGMFWGNAGTSLQNDQVQRNDAWWSLASGARGIVAEDEVVLQWGSTSLAVMTTNGLFQATTKNIYALFTSLPGWYKLIPDTNNALVTAGRGTRAVYSASEYLANTDNYVAASRVPDGSLAVIYCAAAMSITIDQSKMAAGYTATWADPASGALTPTATGSTYSSSGLGNNSAGGADWVLILQGTPVTITDAAGVPDWQPLPPGWFPGADKANTLPAGIPFYVVPQPADQVAAPAAGITTATASLAGAGSVTAVVTQDAGTSTSLAGAGSVTAVVTEIAPATAAGAGAVNGLVTQPGGGTITGSGAVGTAVTQGVIATLGGAGSVTDVVTEAVTANLAGAGAVTDVATQAVTVTIAGAGAVTDVATQAVIAALAGAGAVNAQAGGSAGTASPAGAGAVTAVAVQAVPAASAGAGHLTAAAAQGAIGSPAAAGVLTALATQTATANLAGAGAVTAAAASHGAITAARSTATVTAATTSTAAVTDPRDGTDTVTDPRDGTATVS